MVRQTELVALAAAFLPIIRAAVPTLSGWTTTWSEDFAGTANALPDESNWIVTTGTSYPGGAEQWGTWEIETYTNSPKNIKLNGKGQLEITALKDSAGKWTSAKIETQKTSFMAAAGGKMRIGASISLPDLNTTNGVGYWPAFWTLGATFRGNYTNWPMCGELDIMENVNAKEKIWGTMHCDTYDNGECVETDGRGGSVIPNGTAPQGHFHTYTMEIDRSADVEAVRWFFDDKLYWQLTSDDFSKEVWEQTTHIPYFILLNLAIGGSFPNKVAAVTTPTEATASTGTMKIDWVAVYNHGGKKT